MWNKIILALVITVFFIALACKSKVTEVKQNHPPYLLDTNYIRQDLCECFMNNGYNRNIADTSCYFGDGSVGYDEWWHQVLEMYGNDTEEKPIVIRMLLGSDDGLKKKFKQYCFERQTFPRFASEYFRIKNTGVNNDTSKAVTSKQVRDRLNTVKSSVLIPLYKSYGVHKEEFVPIDGEQSQLSIVTLNFERGLIEVDYIFASDTVLASTIAGQVGQNILKDQWLSNNLNYLSYPLTYWELDQLIPPND